MMKLRILLLLLFCSSYHIQAQEKNYIKVLGSAKMEIVPDEVYIAYVLEARDDDEESIDDIEKSLKSEFLQLGFSAPELKTAVPTPLVSCLANAKRNSGSTELWLVMPNQ